MWLAKGVLDRHSPDAGGSKHSRKQYDNLHWVHTRVCVCVYFLSYALWANNSTSRYLSWRKSALRLVHKIVNLPTHSSAVLSKAELLSSRQERKHAKGYLKGVWGPVL